MFLGPFGILAWQVGDVTVPLKLSRNAELEADLLGLQYMYLAGYDPSEFLRFMDRAYVVEDRRLSRMAQLFSEYPSFEARLSQDRAMISTFPPRVEYMVDTSAFADIKAKFVSPEPEMRREKGSNGPRLRRRTH
jgi:predicted Zn-dependent protease